MEAMYRLCSLRLGPNFGVRSVAGKNLYLRLMVQKMHAFVVYTERYLRPCGYSSTNRMTSVNCRNQKFEILWHTHSMHGHISYILEASFKRPIRKKKKRNRKQSQAMLKKLNALTLFLFQQKYSIIFNCLLCAFKIIIIKGIVYVQCQR